MGRTRRKTEETPVKTIPQLRRSFEHIEEFVDLHIKKRTPKHTLSTELRKEWSRIFKKQLDKESADTFITERINHTTTKKVLRGSTGGALEGAPIQHITQPGIYLAPNAIPQRGTLGGGYGNYTDYLDKGFWNPEMAQSYDPIPHQQDWPRPYQSTGSNLVGGKRKTKGRTRKIRGGSALLEQAFTRPFPTSTVPSVVNDMQTIWYGQRPGLSPDQTQHMV